FRVPSSGFRVNLGFDSEPGTRNSELQMRFTLHVWRQASRTAAGTFETHVVDGITGDVSFLEMFDILNERLQREGKEPIAFDHDCREGICGACNMMVNGQA